MLGVDEGVILTKGVDRSGFVYGNQGGRIGGLICFFPFSLRLHTCDMARSSSTVHWCFECPVAMPKLGAGPTPPLDALQGSSCSPAPPLPKLSFTLGCCSQSERRRHLHKNFPSTLGTCPVEATTSSISTPQGARHHRVNTHHPPPTAAIFNHLAHFTPRCAYRPFDRVPKRPTSGSGQGRADHRVATRSSAGSTPPLPPGRTGDR